MKAMTELQCEKARNHCYQHNIAPIMKELKDIRKDAKADNLELRKEMKTSDDKTREEIQSLALIIKGLPEEMADKFDRRYAGKTTENIVYTMVALILFAVIGAILSGII